MKKSAVIKKLKAAGIEHDPKYSQKVLETLLKADKPAKSDAPPAPKDASTSADAPPAPKVKAPGNIVERKIGADELIPLQKEGRLCGYDPATKMGKVKDKGSATKWPGKEE